MTALSEPQPLFAWSNEASYKA